MTNGPRDMRCHISQALQAWLSKRKAVGPKNRLLRKFKSCAFGMVLSNRRGESAQAVGARGMGGRGAHASGAFTGLRPLCSRWRAGILGLVLGDYSEKVRDPYRGISMLVCYLNFCHVTLAQHWRSSDYGTTSHSIYGPVGRLASHQNGPTYQGVRLRRYRTCLLG